MDNGGEGRWGDRQTEIDNLTGGQTIRQTDSWRETHRQLECYALLDHTQHRLAIDEAMSLVPCSLAANPAISPISLKGCPTAA